MNETEQALVEAFAAMAEHPDIEIEYRVYYDPISKECILKTTEKPEGEFVVVDQDTYESLLFCPNFVIKNGVPIAKPFDYSASILLTLADTGQRAMKDYCMFVVDDSYTGPIDYWTAKE